MAGGFFTNWATRESDYYFSTEYQTIIIFQNDEYSLHANEAWIYPGTESTGMASQTRQRGIPRGMWSPLLQVTPEEFRADPFSSLSLSYGSKLQTQPWEWGGEDGNISKGGVIHSGWLSDPWPSNGPCLRKQHQNHLGACQKSRISGSTPGLLKETLHSKVPTKWFMCTLRSEKHCYRKYSVTTIQSPDLKTLNR